MIDLRSNDIARSALAGLEGSLYPLHCLLIRRGTLIHRFEAIACLIFSERCHFDGITLVY